MEKSLDNPMIVVDNAELPVEEGVFDIIFSRQ
jgi:hypothetical protein